MKLRCYAEGCLGSWEAICLDLDIAVQGESFDDVAKSLRKAIDQFLEEIGDYPAKERGRLLNRKAPIWMRLKYAWALIRSNSDDDNTPIERHEFTLVPAG